jgi:hypothetical protein
VEKHPAFEAEGGARLAHGDPLRANRCDAREGALIGLFHRTFRL